MTSAVVREKGSRLGIASAEVLHRQTQPGGAAAGAQEYNLKKWEQVHISQALQAANGNRTRAAKLLGIGLRTLQRKLKRYNLN